MQNDLERRMLNDETTLRKSAAKEKSYLSDIEPITELALPRKLNRAGRRGVLRNYAAKRKPHEESMRIQSKRRAGSCSCSERKEQQSKNLRARRIGRNLSSFERPHHHRKEQGAEKQQNYHIKHTKQRQFAGVESKFIVPLSCAKRIQDRTYARCRFSAAKRKRSRQGSKTAKRLSRGTKGHFAYPNRRWCDAFLLAVIIPPVAAAVFGSDDDGTITRRCGNRNSHSSETKARRELLAVVRL